MADSSAAPGSRRAAPVAPEAVVQLIVFRLGDEDYGIRIEQVKEVTVTPEVVKMPKTPPFIKGIANLRGDIIAIVDLEERFQLRPAGRPVPDFSYTLAVEAADYTLGLMVREVPRPLTIPVSLIEPAPEFVQDSGQRDKYLEGIAKLPDSEGVIIVLDMAKLLTPSEIMRLPGRVEPPAAKADEAPNAPTPPEKP
ncbi:chemotaxis protein CheW [Hymenobacter sp. BT559]|jgi:purine-binding chemotaxis protein CheW|uniref:chemotaxis protein CheW n=1 Tax=Hymenobacter sp. BT559 TaxID=2795729 RepID=UPI0018ECA446|nr:chemotaxis protein CheW [Hymenobacter sp. BT559]MBJ6144737.1 purine-binding chemotaxis protein CheW [Hymenobacter sp. BT559]